MGSCCSARNEGGTKGAIETKNGGSAGSLSGGITSNDVPKMIDFASKFFTESTLTFLKDISSI